MDCINYNCDNELDDQILNDCGKELLAGISAAIVLECDSQLTDPSSEAEVLAEIAAGRATLIERVKASIDPASPIEVDPLVACETADLVNYDRTGTLMEGNINSGNIEFWQPLLRGRTNGGLILYLCGTVGSNQGAKVLWIDSPVKFKGSLVVAPNNNEQLRIEATFAWRSINDPAMYNAPTGVFGQ